MAVKVSLAAFPPLTTAFRRFAIGIACIALWARWREVRLLPEEGEWPAPAASQFRRVAMGRNSSIRSWTSAASVAAGARRR